MKLGERIYTPEQASEALGGMYAASTLKNMASRGEISHLGGVNGKTRQKIRFSESHLQDFLNSIEQQASKPESASQKDLKKKLAEHY